MGLKDCIADGDKLYCWNNETGEIDVYTRKSVSVGKCPAGIISKLMQMLAEKANGGKNGNDND